MLELILYIEPQEPLSDYELGRAVRWIFYMACFFGLIWYLRELNNEKNEQLLARRERLLYWKTKSDKLSLSLESRQKLIQKIEEYVESLALEKNKHPTFEEFIIDFIKHTSKESTKKLYPFFVTHWHLDENLNTDYDEIHSKYF